MSTPSNESTHTREPVLCVENVAKHFSTAGPELVILRDVSLNAEGAETVAIVGPSGSGKSTLLHIIGGLECPTSGQVRINGVNPHGLRPNPLADFRHRHIGFVFQEHYLLPQLTALENVLVPGLATGSITSELADRGRQLLEAVGLADRMDHRPGQLSGGERQRVAFGRALIMQPLIILADEPTGSLDAASADRIGELLCSLPQQENVTLICVTHSQTLAERFQRQYVLTDGCLKPVSLAQSGSPT